MRHPPTLWPALLIGFISLLAGCLPPASSATDPAPRLAQRDVVTADELRTVGATTLRDALLRLRPELASRMVDGLPDTRRSFAALYVDGLLAAPWALAQIRPDMVAEVRFVRGADAPRLGDGPAILVTTRRVSR